MKRPWIWLLLLAGTLAVLQVRQTHFERYEKVSVGEAIGGGER